MSTTAGETKLTEFDFYRVDPYIESGYGRKVYFRHQGQDYYYETYTAGALVGGELYETETGKPVKFAELDALYEALEHFDLIYDELWDKVVWPVIEAASDNACYIWKAKHGS